MFARNEANSRDKRRSVYQPVASMITHLHSSKKSNSGKLE